MKIWEEHLQTHHQQKRSEIFDTADGFVVQKSINVEPVFEAVKAMAELQSTQRDKNGALYLGSVDMLTAQNWAKECGHPIGTKDWKEYALKQLQSSDYAHFRANTARRFG